MEFQWVQGFWILTWIFFLITEQMHKWGCQMEIGYKIIWSDWLVKKTLCLKKGEVFAVLTVFEKNSKMMGSIDNI